MHTAVLALGLLLILSELGAIGFMMINTINQVTQPQAAVNLVPPTHPTSQRTMKVMVVEDKKIHTSLITDPAAQKPKSKPQIGYFSLVP